MYDNSTTNCVTPGGNEGNASATRDGARDTRIDPAVARLSRASTTIGMLADGQPRIQERGDVKRLHSITAAQIDTSGRAALLSLKFSDGTVEALELERGTVGELLRVLLRVCEGLGEIRANPRPLDEVPPHEAIPISTEYMAVRLNPA